LQEDYSEFGQLNAEILAISVEGVEIGQYVSDLLDLQYPVLSDTQLGVVEQYGVYNLLGDSLATPSVFLIDADGVVRWVYVGETTRDRPSNEMILGQLRDLPSLP
jgi:peroxiredoxin